MALAVWLVISYSEKRCIVNLLRRHMFGYLESFSQEIHMRDARRGDFSFQPNEWCKIFSSFLVIKMDGLVLDWQALDWSSVSRGGVLLWVLKDLVFTLTLPCLFIFLIALYLINHMIKIFTQNYIWGGFFIMQTHKHAVLFLWHK